MISLLKSPKLPGLALIVGSICALAGNITHPRTVETSELATPASAEIIHHTPTEWSISHAILILTFPFFAWGFIGLYARLTKRGQHALALPATVAMGFYTILSTIVLLLDGFVAPIIAKRFMETSGSMKEMLFAVFEYHHYVILVFLAFAWLVLCSALILYAISLLKAKLYPKWLAWMGMLIGAVGLLGYAFGLFGKFWVYVSIFPPFAGILTLWILILGVYFVRDPQTD
jgi:hypothetical protein